LFSKKGAVLMRKIPILLLSAFLLSINFLCLCVEGLEGPALSGGEPLSMPKSGEGGLGPVRPEPGPGGQPLVEGTGGLPPDGTPKPVVDPGPVIGPDPGPDPVVDPGPVIGPDPGPDPVVDPGPDPVVDPGAEHVDDTGALTEAEVDAARTPAEKAVEEAISSATPDADATPVEKAWHQRVAETVSDIWGRAGRWMKRAFSSEPNMTLSESSADLDVVVKKAAKADPASARELEAEAQAYYTEVSSGVSVARETLGRYADMSITTVKDSASAKVRESLNEELIGYLPDDLCEQLGIQRSGESVSSAMDKLSSEAILTKKVFEGISARDRSGVDLGTLRDLGFGVSVEGGVSIPDEQALSDRFDELSSELGADTLEQAQNAQLDFLSSRLIKSLDPKSPGSNAENVGAKHTTPEEKEVLRTTMLEDAKTGIEVEAERMSRLKQSLDSGEISQSEYDAQEKVSLERISTFSEYVKTQLESAVMREKSEVSSAEYSLQHYASSAKDLFSPEIAEKFEQDPESVRMADLKKALSSAEGKLETARAASKGKSKDSPEYREYRKALEDYIKIKSIVASRQTLATKGMAEADVAAFNVRVDRVTGAIKAGNSSSITIDLTGNKGYDQAIRTASIKHRSAQRELGNLKAARDFMLELRKGKILTVRDVQAAVISSKGLLGRAATAREGVQKMFIRLREGLVTSVVEGTAAMSAAESAFPALKNLSSPKARGLAGVDAPTGPIGQAPVTGPGVAPETTGPGLSTSPGTPRVRDVTIRQHEKANLEGSPKARRLVGEETASNVVSPKASRVLGIGPGGPGK
jgi:hypothetical protein